MTKQITNFDMVDIAIAAQECGKTNIGNAKFKYALILAEGEIMPRIKSLVKIAGDLLKDYTDAFKKEIVCERKTEKGLSITHFGLVSIPLPDDFDEVAEKQKIVELQARFAESLKAVEELMKEKIELNLHMITTENIPDNIDYNVLKQLKVIISDENVSAKS